ncbi:hypothetical protein N8I77_009612 [Diaporthe amygdali]|uniref:NACHT domain-containing protein n=1 Tax=Phomopsis amygdali TaxID=1214568 RepID=A0AAD9SBI7_PHOAM|nr:hypothetical protein N8I77_009612 [Diaporthe amygdali]
MACMRASVTNKRTSNYDDKALKVPQRKPRFQCRLWSEKPRTPSTSAALWPRQCCIHVAIIGRPLDTLEIMRNRDRIASWFRPRRHRLLRNGLKNDVALSNLPAAHAAAQTVSIGVGPRLQAEPARGPKLEPQSQSHSETEDKAQQSVWQKAWILLCLKDQQIIDTVAQSFETHGEVFSNLERVAHQRKQEFYDRQWNSRLPISRENTVRIRVLISRIITCLRRFKEVGDIAVSFDPSHASLPWAAFRFLLEVVTVDDEQLGLLMDGLERVSLLSLRVTIYEKLYLSSSCEAWSEAAIQLERAIVPLCKDMLLFIAMAIRKLDKNTAVRAIGALFNPSAVLDLLKSMNAHSDQAHMEAANCEHFLRFEDRKLLNLVVDDLVNIDSKIEELWVRLDENERSKLLQWLSPIYYASDHDFARKGRVGDTGSWLLHKTIFQQWEKSSVSEIFWLHGIPGAGKTKLSSKVVDYIDTALRLDKARDREALVYFYCDRNRADHRDPLSTDRGDTHVICQIVEEQWRLQRRKGFPSNELPLHECKKILPQLIAAHTRTTMVVDGLDECDKDSRHELIRILNNIVESPNCLIKIFISSREDRDLAENYETHPHLQVQAYDNDYDIRSYVLAQLANTPNSWFREKLPLSLKNTILQTFSRKSDGMFQWAVLQMDGLLQLKRASDVESYLGCLPKGMSETYQKILQNISDQAGSAPIIAARAFKWIMDSDRPLHPSELVAAVCHSSDGLASCEPDFKIEFVLEACHHLVVVTESSCRFSHLSVQEYLESHDWPNKPDDQLLGTVCLQILMDSKYTVDENTLNIRALQTSLYLYAAIRWPRHCIDCDPGVFETESLLAPLLARFLGYPTHSSQNYRKWVGIVQLLKPIVRMWIEPSDLQPSHLAAFGVVALGLLGTIARWSDCHVLDPNLSSSDRSLLDLAVKSGNVAMCSRLVYSGADINHSNLTGGTPILGAVMKRRYSVVEILANQANIDIDKGRDVAGASVLCKAVSFGDAKTVELLLNAGANPNLIGRSSDRHEAGCKDFASALHVAAGIGAVDLMCILLDFGADPNLVAGKHQTPLMHAVESGQKAAVDFLIQSGADVNLFRPLYRTAREDRWYRRDVEPSEITMALVDKGALDYVLNLPPEDRIELDERYADMVDWLDERLATSDLLRRRRRSMRMSETGFDKT